MLGGSLALAIVYMCSMVVDIAQKNTSSHPRTLGESIGDAKRADKVLKQHGKFVTVFLPLGTIRKNK